MRIILIGGGPTAYYLAREFSGGGHQITVIDRSPQDAHKLARQSSALVVIGDGSSPDVLEQAGARQADLVIALTPHDEDNLIACQLAARAYGVQRTLALVNDPENEEIFKRLGVQAVFSVTRIIGQMIEQQADFDVSTILPMGNGQVNIVDVHLDDDSPATGQPLHTLNLPPETLIACILRGDDVVIPRGSEILRAGDHLVLIAHVDTQREMLQRLIGENGE